MPRKTAGSECSVLVSLRLVTLHKDVRGGALLGGGTLARRCGIGGWWLQEFMLLMTWTCARLECRLCSKQRFRLLCVHVAQG
eukprot:850779-Amphidinium_carterae.1